MACIDQAKGHRPDFEIGLALSGAISAGAYTAGVLDFLIQALEAWEDTRAAGAPEHTVKIRTIAGASAGAVTGGLGLVALSRGLSPQKLSPSEVADSNRGPDVAYQKLRCVLPALYETWVTRPRMVAAGPGQDLLGDTDMKGTGVSKKARKRGHNLVRSVLNAQVLDEIKNEALSFPRSVPPVEDRKAGLPFLSETMHLYITVSNLRGIPFQIDFGNATYDMQTHGDRFHYAVTGVGTGQAWDEPDWLARDKSLQIDAKTLPQADDQRVPAEWDDYGTCCLASAAFPVGLAPRALVAQVEQYIDRQYPLPVALSSVKPKFPVAMSSSDQYKFLNVDGGMINNNPFDYVQYALMGSHKATTTDRAVIMIAPFPEPPNFLPEGQPVAELASVLRALFPTLINQARFRTSELGPAMNPADYSRFLISPHRSLVAGPDERFPIACGLLGGFGGFLDESFRAHDFQLGRRNCQRFLQTAFGLPDNGVFERGTARFRDFPLARSAAHTEAYPNPHYMLIPLVGDAAAEVALPRWPQMSGADLRTLVKRIQGRIAAVSGPLIDSQTDKAVVRAMARLGLWAQGDRIIRYIQLTIIADLVRRNQIRGWDLPQSVVDFIEAHRTPAGSTDLQTDDARAILSVLASPARDAMTLCDLAAATHLPKPFVRGVLERLADLPVGQPHRIIVRDMPTGSRLYSLEMRCPTGIRAWPMIGPLVDRFVPRVYAYN